ncbi:uncharacterized protein PHACADRAFT_106712 [Phanerochaete carnosa HHB-10118-sp]|uniref:AB hydrolase-1 domain-containing protein n=1 Tax=Phanerochaete carnosa (strain HHB-10118-sp) TaxID=650164 RepID=K5VSG9_PHACS|nr:uncharacterized protein PHACADRAFT_106712 [Phanerochaete carnosa HHB-10118-sp]EKM49720.1 hypothetical protein PHACADRAFT_106712 [Phanerochaete carnosa HHB-10118-sp]
MTSEAHKQPKKGLFACVYASFFYLGLLYPVIIGVLSIPEVQKHFAYGHGLKFPLFTKYDAPEKYSLAPGKTFNTNFSTPDNCTLGAWFVLADPYYQNLRMSSPKQLSPLTKDAVLGAIQAFPTILFLHGAGGTRATSWRVGSYRSFTSRLQANVFSIDYRGFGDSTGSPDSDGLILDAYTAWRWLLQHGAEPEDVVIYGHSLGTGVAGQLMRRLAIEGVAPRGVALLGPFSSLSKLIETHAFLGIPILQPLQSFSWGLKLLKYIIRHEFDTLAAIQDFHVPTFVAHSQNDMEVPHTHAKTLIDTLLEPLLPEATVQLPSAPGKTLTTEEFLAFRKQQKERSLKRGEIVRTTDVPNFGMIEEFQGLHSPIVYVETFWGSHAEIGAQEGVQDQMAKLFGLGAYRAQRREGESVVHRAVRHLTE